MRSMGSRRGNEAAFVFALATSFVAATAAVACGGGGNLPPGTPGSVSANANGARPDGGSPGNGSFALTPPPSGLPPVAVMPPAGVAGSKKAKKKGDPALFSCGGGARPIARDPADHVKRLGESCASAAKMKAVGPMIRAQQADKDAHQEHKLRVEANKCYRVVFATDENIHDAVVVMRDSAGDVVAESAGAALPEDGAVCFTTADEVTLLIGIGSGKGAYAAQVWSD